MSSDCTDDGEICEVINAYFAGKRLDEITPRMVREFQASRRDTVTQHGRQRKAATVNRELSVLSRIFGLAVEYEVIEHNPCAKVRNLTPEPNRIDYLLEEDEERLLSFCRDERAHLHDIVTVALNTGLRPGNVELLGLQVEQIDFARNVIELTKHKTAKRTGRTRIIPLNSLVKEILTRLTQGKKANDFVFTNPLTNAPYTEIKKGFKRACKLAGIPAKKAYPYILRHTFGTRLAMKGVKVAEIKELMGHTSVEMTMRYVHATARGKHDAVQLLVKDAPIINEPLPTEEWISAEELAHRLKIKLETIYTYIYRSKVPEMMCTKSPGSSVWLFNWTLIKEVPKREYKYENGGRRLVIEWSAFRRSAPTIPTIAARNLIAQAPRQTATPAANKRSLDMWI